MGRGGVKKRLILLYFFKRRLKNRLFYSKIYCFKNFAGSANGRPRDSESRYLGPNPSPAAKVGSIEDLGVLRVILVLVQDPMT